jgi:RNA polymerase sigma factor (sigma-70 family)
MKKKVPTNAEYLQLISEWKATDCQKEKNRVATIILQGLEGLIWKIVRRRSHWMPEATQEDCYSEACIAIIRQVLPNFDAEKAVNCKFSSYASNWISNGVGRTLDKQSSVVNVPGEGRNKARKALEAGEELSFKQRAYLPTFVYWDKPLSTDDEQGQSLLDYICSNEGITTNNPAIENIEKVQLSAYTQRLLDSIENPKHRLVVKMKMNDKTYKEIADLLGVTRQRIEQIYNKSIKGLRVTAASWALRTKHAEPRQERKTKGIEFVDNSIEGSWPDESGITPNCRKAISKRARARKFLEPSVD